MIRLDQHNLQNMYPAMSPEFSARMDRLIHTLPSTKEEHRMKHSSIRTAIIAALIILAMSTTAYALTRPAVLQWLLGNRPASSELESTVQNLSAEASADGITARITGVVYDGAQMAFSYELENADPTQPMLIALDSILLVNDEEHSIPHPDYTYNVRMVPSPHLDVLPARRNPVTGGVWCDLPSGLTGQMECAVTFIVYRPEKAFAVLIDPDHMLRDTSLTGDAAAEAADARRTMESFHNAVIIEPDEVIPEDWSAQGYTPVDESGTPFFEAQDALSNLIEVTRITVPFTIDANKAIAHDFSGAQADFDDFTVHAESFRLTPLRTYVDVRLLPRENSESAAHALAEHCGPYTLTDDRGQPVIYSDMDYCSSPEPYVTCMDGQWVCRYLIDMPGLLSFPESVGFTVQTGELIRFSLSTAN